MILFPNIDTSNRGVPNDEAPKTRLTGVTFWVNVWVFVLIFMTLGEASAFFTTMKYTAEDRGKREVLSFRLPHGAKRPTLTLLEPQILRITVPGILALPAIGLDLDRSRWISSFEVEEITTGTMGLYVTFGLKKPLLSFRDSLSDDDPITGPLYRLEIDQLPPPTGKGPATLLEGRVLTGRDGTLIVFSHIGKGVIETSVDRGARMVQIHWRPAGLDPRWRRVNPQGFAERILAYEFPRGQVEMEILISPQVEDVFFYKDADAGLLIIELVSKNGMGRRDDAERIILERKEQMTNGQPHPLNRLDRVFVRTPDTIEMEGHDVDEGFFMQSAQDAARDHNFAVGRAYLDQWLRNFPDTPNREIIEFFKWDLANSMGWKSGWLLAELEAALAHHPNVVRYPHYRLEQLKLFNRSGLYENASAIMWDPNLPKDLVDVWLERGRTAMGLAHATVDQNENWKASESHFNRVLELSENKGDLSAEAHYLLAKLAEEQHDIKKAIQTLDGLSREQIARIANRPEWLMGVADIYYQSQLYDRALVYYAQFLSNYPEVKHVVPWALLRFAEASRQVGRTPDARRAFASLKKNYPESDSAIWGRIFELRLNADQTLEKRIEMLDKVIKTIALPDALAEALVAKAELLGEAGRHQEAIKTLNHLLSLTSRLKVGKRAKQLKRDYLIVGMKKALETERPEYAALLAEVHGEDWRKDPNFALPRLYLAEALMRMGLSKQALPLLQGIDLPSVPALVNLGTNLLKGDWSSIAHRPESSGPFTSEEVRVRLDEAVRLVDDKAWESVLILLNEVPAEQKLNKVGQAKRLRLMAKAEVGRGRFPQAVRHLEDLLFGQPLADGSDYYWYATVLQQWKGDTKSLPAFQLVSVEAENKEIQALALIRVGDIMQRAGDFKSAQAQYQKVAALVPDSPWAKVSEENAAQLEMAMEVAR